MRGTGFKMSMSSAAAKTTRAGGRDALRNVRVIGDTANFVNDADVIVRILSIIARCSCLGILAPIAVFAVLAVILVFGERFQ